MPIHGARVASRRRLFPRTLATGRVAAREECAIRRLGICLATRAGYPPIMDTIINMANVLVCLKILLFIRVHTTRVFLFGYCSTNQ